MKKIIISSLKGGVGKSLISLNFAAYLYHKRKRVLVIDMDAQTNMTSNMNLHENKRKIKYEYTSADILALSLQPEAEIYPDDIIVKNPLQNYEGFDLIPADTNTKMIEDLVFVNNHNSYFTALDEWMREHHEELSKRYDYIVMDAGPSLSVGAINALITADSIFMITDYSENSLNGVFDLYQKWSAMTSQLNRENNIKVAFVNNVNVNTNMGSWFLSNIEASRGRFPVPFCKNVIKSSSKIRESELTGPVIFSMDYKTSINPGVKSMFRTFDEIVKGGYLK